MKPNNSLKVGDFLFCHNDLVMNSLIISAVKGNKYKIIEVNSYEVYIINDYDRRHSFNLDPEHKSYYKKWFDNLKYDRMMKLNKLKSISSESDDV